MNRGQFRLLGRGFAGRADGHVRIVVKPLNANIQGCRQETRVNGGREGSVGKNALCTEIIFRILRGRECGILAPTGREYGNAVTSALQKGGCRYRRRRERVGSCLPRNFLLMSKRFFRVTSLVIEPSPDRWAFAASAFVGEFNPPTIFRPPLNIGALGISGL